MQSRNFFNGIAILSFLSLFSGLTFVHLEAAVRYYGESNGKLDNQHSKMLIERIEKKLEAKRSEIIELYRDFCFLFCGE